MITIISVLAGLIFFLLMLQTSVLVTRCTRIPGRAAEPAREREFRVMSLNDAFDPSLAMIWQTQLPALRIIDQEGCTGLPLEKLSTTFERLCRSHPEVFEGTSRTAWLRFLERTALIFVERDRAYITTAGREFLAAVSSPVQPPSQEAAEVIFVGFF